MSYYFRCPHCFTAINHRRNLLAHFQSNPGCPWQNPDYCIVENSIDGSSASPPLEEGPPPPPVDSNGGGDDDDDGESNQAPAAPLFPFQPLWFGNPHSAYAWRYYRMVNVNTCWRSHPHKQGCVPQLCESMQNRRVRGRRGQVRRKGARLTTVPLQSLLVKEEMSIRFPSLKLHRLCLLTTLLMSARWGTKIIKNQRLVPGRSMLNALPSKHHSFGCWY